MRAVTTSNEITSDLLRAPIFRIGHARMAAVKIQRSNVLGFEDNGAIERQPRQARPLRQRCPRRSRTWGPRSVMPRVCQRAARGAA